MRREALQILIFILYKMTLIYVMELVYFDLPCHIVTSSWICSSKDKRVSEQYTLHITSNFTEVGGKEYNKQQVYTQLFNTMVRPSWLKKALPFSICAGDSQTVWS